MLVDSHAHINDERFQGEQQAVVERAAAAGVDLIVNAGATMTSSEESIRLAERYSMVYASVGVHPHDVKEIQGEEEYQQLAQWAVHEKVVAIGEIGLDYYYDLSPRDMQQMAFIRQLDVARQMGLPVIIHDRDAHGDLLHIAKNEMQGLTGVFHCFSGSVEMMRELVKLGFYIGIGGTVTFSNAAKVKEVAKAVPIDRLMIETDCPYLTPAPYRGKRNEPAYVRYVAEEIGRLRELDWQEVGQIASENTRRLFGIL